MPHTHTASVVEQCKTALPVCPACGGLECLCRPRFFCGQVLTDEDLNRLEHYIIEKNKLHNRYIHGWGVACGMEVLCHPCEGFVTVKAGYALSPCGNDIVVCRDEAVNVCELLRKCREDMQRHWECDPEWPRPQPECEQDQQWVLYICYEEKSSRGITALRGSSAPACCSGCSCGGSSACGCGCHGQHDRQMKSSYRPLQKRAPLPQCEPTITCEGYSFQLRKLPHPQDKDDRGAMFNRMVECLEDVTKLQQSIKALPNTSPHSAVNAIKQDFLLLLERHGIQNCELHRRLLQPLPLPATISRTVVRNYFREFIIEAIRQCLCSALMPPCPEPVAENCVPLARVTINCKDGCRVVRVCNWEDRRIVATVPAIEYWLEGFVKPNLVQFLIALCCDPIRERRGDVAFIDGLPLDTSNPGAVFEPFKEHLKRILADLMK
jgi:hypothetical protein